MDITTYPELEALIDSLDVNIIFTDPFNIRIKEDIGNPVMIIDNTIEHLEKKGEMPIGFTLSESLVIRTK